MADKIQHKYMDQEEYDEIMDVNSVCIGNNYLPYPTRLWYRTSNLCSTPDPNVFVPYLNREVSREELSSILEVFRKGNVLQYPANRWTTKTQTFTSIAKGYTRKKCWASQTDTITQPNVNKLQRNNPNIISNNTNDEYFFPECFIPDKKDINFPNYIPTISTETGTEPTNPTYPNVSNSTSISNASFAFPISTPFIPENKLIPSTIEGGTLVSCTTENTCSGIISSQIKNISCIPTSDSNVPGPIIELCYPTNMPTTSVRRKTYASSSTKWPVNGTFLPAYNTNLPVNQNLVKKLSTQFTLF